MPSKDFRFGISSDIRGIDLNKVLIDHPLNSYFMRIADDMPELDLRAGDVVLVDRSLQPKKNDLVVVSLNSDRDLLIMRFSEITGESELWGVVVHLIRKLRSWLH